MCGIAGVWFSNPVGRDQLEGHARAMGGAMRHRGPDAEGVWSDVAQGLALTHRRLSILDLSEAGSQPMHSQCGRYVLVYNGECYNFPELRDELMAEGCAFRGSSDTEVIVEGCARWGFRRTLERLNGMFAFALWDRQSGKLMLARDRLGIKPLYYGWSSDILWFGSELTALRSFAPFSRQLNLEGLGLFFKYGYVPAPHSIFQNVFKLPAAHCLVLESATQRGAPECYWNRIHSFSKGEQPAFDGNEQDATAELHRLLRNSVRGQMISDVPLGAFLSGGIDSSTVVALMQAQSSRPVKTFTIGFEEDGFNEAESARAVAQHLKTEHHELVLSAAEAQAIVPLLGEMFDEPFADASQIPTYAVSRLARRHVTVSLSGDGGDELFAGYQHYAVCAPRLERLNRTPYLAARALSAAALALGEGNWDRFLRRVPGARRRIDALSGFKVHKYASVLAQRSSASRYDLMNARWFAPETLVRGLSGRTGRERNGAGREGVDLFDLMAAADLNQYLPEDILTKVDRASMAVSLESRVPILDQEVVAFALSLPLAYKRRHGQGKVILRNVLRQYVPSELFERPKKGFSVPVAHWIRGPLRDWAEQGLEACRRCHSDVLDLAVIQTKWQEHLTGRRNWVELLWPVLMFGVWAETNLRGTVSNGGADAAQPRRLETSGP